MLGGAEARDGGAEAREAGRQAGGAADTRGRIRAFLARYIRERDLRDGEDIFATGSVNSLFAMQLVLFIEKEFGITIGNQDLEIASFRSVDAMAGLVRRKQESLADAAGDAATSPGCAGRCPGE
jgi:methoxymalonate biosynthesis acyl carrier protein